MIKSETQSAVVSSALLADMQRCLLWMEHENRCAEREEKMGHWLSDHTGAMHHWDAEFQKARDAFMSANAGTQRPGTPGGSLATETRKPGSLK